jgi:hypothetical protein
MIKTMLMIAILISVLLPIQVHPEQAHTASRNYLWAAHAVMDATLIITLRNQKRGQIIENLNPELILREPNPDDRPIPRRLQFIQDYVNQTAYLPAKSIR